jgi:hypothetical protein
MSNTTRAENNRGGANHRNRLGGPQPRRTGVTKPVFRSNRIEELIREMIANRKILVGKVDRLTAFSRDTGGYAERLKELALGLKEFAVTGRDDATAPKP